MKLVGRLAALEQRIPREVLGYQVTRVAPDGAVLHEIVLLVSGRPGMATRYFSVDGFYETYPAGQISKLADLGGRLARLANATWPLLGAERVWLDDGDRHVVLVRAEAGV